MRILGRCSSFLTFPIYQISQAHMSSSTHHKPRPPRQARPKSTGRLPKISVPASSNKKQRRATDMRSARTPPPHTTTIPPVPSKAVSRTPEPENSRNKKRNSYSPASKPNLPPRPKTTKHGSHRSLFITTASSGSGKSRSQPPSPRNGSSRLPIGRNRGKQKTRKGSYQISSELDTILRDPNFANLPSSVTGPFEDDIPPLFQLPGHHDGGIHPLGIAVARPTQPSLRKSVTQLSMGGAKKDSVSDEYIQQKSRRPMLHRPIDGKPPYYEVVFYFVLFVFCCTSPHAHSIPFSK